MPKSLDPSSQLTIVLACDVDKPANVRPTIYARTLTINQQKNLIRAMMVMQQAVTPIEKMDAALDAAEVCLTGLNNMINPQTSKPIEFCRDSIGDVLNIDELTEIFDGVTSMSVASGSDKKKSESPH